MRSIALATEDELSEAVGRRLLAEGACQFHIGPVLRRGGSGYLHSRMKSWCELARSQSILLITDLDRHACPVTMKADWLRGYQAPENLLFRIAVREIESWLLADHEAIRVLLGKGVSLPSDADGIVNPKQRLLQLASKAKRQIREDLVAVDGATTRQGIAYNARLRVFVGTVWEPARAARNSDSLRRARRRIAELGKSSS